MQFIYSLFAFIFVISFLVTVHEFGHFIAARTLGVKVLKFSVGFGPKLFSCNLKSETEFQFCLIPLGGYVQLFGEEDQFRTEGSYSSKTNLEKIIILLAGPVANIITAFFCFYIVNLVGTLEVRPVIDYVPKNSLADQAGLKKGDQIYMVGANKVTTWEEVNMRLIKYIGSEQEILITASSEDEKQKTTYKIEDINWNNINPNNILLGIGIVPMFANPPVLSKIFTNSPASTAELQIGDRIIAVGQQNVFSSNDVAKIVRKKPNSEISFQIKRDEQIFNKAITLGEKVQSGGDSIGILGVEFLVKDNNQIQKYLFHNSKGLLASVASAVNNTIEHMYLSFIFVKKIIFAEISTQYINGPVAIAKYSGLYIQIGIINFIDFIAKISISIAAINLLPIPMLDGGQIFICAIEELLGIKINSSIKEKFNILGLLVIMFLTFMALKNDVVLFY